MAPLQISQHRFESCPIAKSPQGSPNPRQPLKRARMKLFSEQRELKRAKSQSQRLPACHWLKAKEQPCVLRPDGPAADGQIVGWGGGGHAQAQAIHLTPPAAQKKLPRAKGLPTLAPSPCQ